MNRTLGLVLGAALIPTIASADSPETTDPYAPQPAPTTSTTTVVTPPPQQQQQPVVVVNPQPQPPRTTVIQQPREGYEVYDAWNAPVFATGALVFAGAY